MSANRMVRPPNGANARVDVRVGSNSEFGTLSRGVRFTPVADIVRLSRHVRKVPENDIAAQEIWRMFSCILLTRHAEVRK